MNKVIKYSLLLLAITISLVSCTKWIDLKPNDGIIREEFWQTKEQVQAALKYPMKSLDGRKYGNASNPIPEEVMQARVSLRKLLQDIRASMKTPAKPAKV